jgi:transcriptional regulator with XRE-family HTH domain
MKINTDRIKQLRDLMGFSQEAMADKMAMSQTAYSRFETGETKVDFERLLKLANLLNADPLTLVQTSDKNITLNHSNNNVVSDYIDHQYMMVDKELLNQLQQTI